eukprot:TRINITY_DN294_c0_g1_i1.p1 TRINITY_DN294_c0_g1~~TRINITY_DN294_c0_g1_i1.p1  ORF type:complete len:513 (-),score=119.26 TRINITY_DN294_c0_g1_i1:1474-3012(-)
MKFLGSSAVPILITAAAWAFFQLPEDADTGGWFQAWYSGRQHCGLLNVEEFTLYSQRVVTPKGAVPAAVHVRRGVIQWVAPSSRKPPAGRHPVLDYGSSVIMPGLIDVHMHMSEPGRKHWEGMATGTRAAAAGGFTTVVDMPLNSIPTTTTPEFLRAKLRASKGKLAIDVGFWGGLTPENGGNETALQELLDAGVLGLKSFMCPSGSDFPQTSIEHIKAALPLLGRYGLPLLVHSELPQPLSEEPSGAPQVYETYLKSRPPEWERAAISALIDASRSSPESARAHIHVVHLSDADSLPLITAARASGAPLTVETCTHYINFAAEDIENNRTEYKCAPPIRGRANRDKLWEGLLSGEIDLLSSDHSPSPPEMKLLEEGDFLRAWGGVASTQFGLPATWTRAKERGATLEDIARWWSTKPAELAHLNNKGSIEAGKDADFVIWDPEAVHTITKDTIQFKNKLTPYEGMQVTGKVEHTFVRGQLVHSQGRFASPVCGDPIIAFTPRMAFKGAEPT